MIRRRFISPMKFSCVLSILAATLAIPQPVFAATPAVFAPVAGHATSSTLIPITDPSPETTGVLPQPDPEAAAAIQSAPPAQQQAMINSMVQGLAAKLEKNPNNLNGWMLLAKSYRVLGKTDKAAEVDAKIKDLKAKGIITAESPKPSIPEATAPSAPPAPPASDTAATAAPASSPSMMSPSGLVNIPPPPRAGMQSEATPEGTKTAPDTHVDANMNAMVEGLRVKLEKNPNNFSGWVLLSNSYRTLGQVDKANAVDAKIRDLKAKGILTVPASAMKAPTQPTTPTPSSTTSTTSSPADSPTPAVASTAKVKVKVKTKTQDNTGSASPATTSATGDEAKLPPPTDQATAKAMMAASPDQQNAMIRSMVKKLEDKLDKNPNDVEGWKHLAQSYRVLGMNEKADAAQDMVEELETKK